MKRMSWSERAWWVVGLVAVLTVAPVWSEVRPNFSTIVGGEGGGTPDDDSVTTAKVLNGTLLAEDHAADTLTVNQMADGSWTLFTITNNAAAFTNGDLGDVTAASGLLTVDTGAITSGKILNGTISADDVNRWGTMFLDLCPAGTNAAANVCVTLTSQGAGPTSFGASALKLTDTNGYHDFRLYVHVGGTGATATDIDLQCDTAITFPSATTMVQITQANLGANTVGSSAWTAFGADECFGTDVFLRPVAVGGNGSESPVIRQAWVAFR